MKVSDLLAHLLRMPTESEVKFLCGEAILDFETVVFDVHQKRTVVVLGEKRGNWRSRLAILSLGEGTKRATASDLVQGDHQRPSPNRPSAKDSS